MFKHYKPTDLVKCHVCKQMKKFATIKSDMKEYQKRVDKNPFGMKTPKKICAACEYERDLKK